MSFCFGNSASGGLERIHFLLKETWTLLLLVEAGNGPFSSILFLTLSFEFDNFSDHYKKVVIGVLHYSPNVEVWTNKTVLSFISGHFGLWVDENLYLGRSSPCFTFNNCCLSETDDFRIMDLEAWTFS